eukprot:gene7409-8229_t
MASRAFSVVRSSARNLGAGFRGISSNAGKKSWSVSPLLLGTLTAACTVGGLAYYANEKKNCFGMLETVRASAYIPPPTKAMGNTDRTFIMIKPDGVERGLIADIIKRFEQRGYKLVAMKFVKPEAELLQKHYADLKEKPFFPSLMKYVGSGPVVAMVWEGKDAVNTGRVMLGETNPLASKPGSIRGDYSIDIGRNICHGSDSNESAAKEIGLWFSEKELVDWTPVLKSMGQKSRKKAEESTSIKSRLNRKRRNDYFADADKPTDLYYEQTLLMTPTGLHEHKYPPTPPPELRNCE